MTTSPAVAGIPKRLRVSQEAGGLEITWWWFSGGTVFFTLFAAFWDTFVLNYFRPLLKPGMPWMVYLFPGVFVAVGAAVTYLALSGWLNQTRIRVAPDALTVNTWPLPYFNNRNITPTEIQRVYCHEYKRRARHGTSYIHTYEARVVLHSGRDLQLARQFETIEPAQFIVDRIHEILGITEEPAPEGARPTT